MVGSFEVIPTDAKPKETSDATKEIEGSSEVEKKGEDKAEIVDLDMEPKGVEVTKPAGKPAEKNMPRPEKPWSPRQCLGMQKAPRLSAETDRALKKLEGATEAKEQAAWLDPEDMASRIPTEYVGVGRKRFVSTKLSYLFRGHAIENGAPSPEFDPLGLCMDFMATVRVLGRYVQNPTIKEVLLVVRNDETRRFQVKVTKPDAPEAT